MERGLGGGPEGMFSGTLLQQKIAQTTEPKCGGSTHALAAQPWSLTSPLPSTHTALAPCSDASWHILSAGFS